jgi:hypothetical protein
MKPKAIQLLCAIFAVALFSVNTWAQAKPADDKRAPIVRENEAAWKNAKKWTLSYIDAMPENAMSFKPTPEVRSFA